MSPSLGYSLGSGTFVLAPCAAVNVMVEHASHAVGIDLGTTFSVIAYLNPAGLPESLPNAEGDYTTPSVVLFEPDGVTVGKEAVKAAALEPDRYADFAKRDMGSPAYHRPIAGKTVPPEVIQSLILKKLKQDAAAKIGPVERAVITVPAYFNEPRRKATQDAGELAGWQVLDIINEPTAAAIAFGYREEFLNKQGAARTKERVLVYDLGGGTFDVTLMEIEGHDYRTLATDGDVYLGGTDWDRRLADHFAEQFQRKFGFDPRQRPDGLPRLLREAEDAKRALSAREQVTVAIEMGGQGLRVPVTREQFESLTEDLLQRTLFTTRQVLREAKLEWTDLTRLLLVGGSSRMPAVKRALEEASGLTADQSISADEAVAHGAAIYAGIVLSQTKKVRVKAPPLPPMTVQDVNSHNLGVLAQDPQTGRPRNVVLIPRNTPLPVTRGKRFRTAKTGQPNIAVRVVEGGDSGGRNSTPIGDCIVHDLPGDLPKGTPVDVFFTYASNGRLTVTAKVGDPSHEATLVLERKSGLSDTKLAKWKTQLLKTSGPLDVAE